MATTLATISCDALEAEAIRLRALFTACEPLTAKDLDSLTLLAYSASLCSSTSITQDNIPLLITVPPVRLSNESVTTVIIANAINAMDPFTLSQIQTAVFHISVTRTTNTDLVIESYWYKLINVGAGNYGSAQTQLTASNLLSIVTVQEEFKSTNESTNPILYDVETSDESELSTPHIVVNGSQGPFSIVANTDYYFKVRVSNTNNYKLYLWLNVSGVGNYGVVGGDTSASGDFQFVSEISESTTVYDADKIKFRNILVNKTLVDNDNIEDAVNARFLNQLIIGNKEIVTFQAVRIFTTGEVRSQNEWYFWTKGSSTINSDTTNVDFLKFETIITDIKSESGKTVIVYDEVVKDITLIAAAINNSASTYVITGIQEVYFVLNNSNVNETSTTNKYTKWLWTGAVTAATGTFGFGGTTVVTGDFTQVVDSIVPVTYLIDDLPTGSLGDTAIVTDATSPTYLGALTDGGAVTCSVFNNGSGWVSN